jgi:tetratricopeptide (TPR) repeat protein
VLVERDGALVLKSGLQDLGIPGTLRDLLMARLDRLGHAKETAQVAAAIGREFSVELLRAAVPYEEAMLREDLDSLVTADLLHRKRRMKGATYAFKHALVQDTAYDSMVKARKRSVHERIARAIEKSFASIVEEQPELLAWHCERAGLDAEATGYLAKAGKQAMQRSAFVEAAALLMHGVEIAERAGTAAWALRRELQLRTLLSGALASRGYADPAFEANGLRLRQVCDEVGDGSAVFPVLFTLFLVNLVRGVEIDEAERYAQQLLAIGENAPNPYTRLSAYSARGVTSYYQYRYDEASEWLNRATRCYHPGMRPDLLRKYGDDPGLFAWAYLQLTEVLRGRIGEALRWVEQTRVLAEELENPLTTAFAGVYSAITYHYLGDYTRMATETARALELSAKHGFIHWEMLSRISHGLLLARGGDVEKGLSQIRRGLSYMERINQWTGRPYFTVYLVEALVEAGRTADAIRVSEEMADSASGKLDRNDIPLHLYMKASIRAATGDREGAMHGHQRALERAAAQGNHYAALRASLGLARLLLEASRREEAHAYLAAAVPRIHGGEGWSEYDEASRLLAALSGAP